MFLFFKNKYLLIIFFLFQILLACSFPKSESNSRQYSNYLDNNQSININNLIINLYEADKKLTPKLIHNKDGSSAYRYIKKPGEGEISLEEIKERILLGPDFYKKDRKDVINKTNIR